MKVYLIALLVLITLKGCSQEQQINSLGKVHYTASTRGYFIDLIAEEKGILIKQERGSDGEFKSFSKDEWSTILGYVNKDMASEKNSSSGDAAFDAAIPAKLVLSFGQKAYVHEFDHGNPPEELKPMVDYLLSFR